MYDADGNYWDDNGDGSLTNPNTGEIVDLNFNPIGTDNGNGTWTDTNGFTYDDQGNPLDGGPALGGDNGTGGDATSGAPAGSGSSDGWIDNGDGTWTLAATGDIYDFMWNYVGNTADAGVGGGNVTLQPDEFGDVYTVSGAWVGNIYGDPKPNYTADTPAGQRGTNNTPGGAYSGGGVGGGGGAQQQGGSSSVDLVKTLQQLLAAAKQSNAPVTQQAALSSALANAQKTAGLSSGAKIGLATAALAALFVFTRSR